MSMLKGTYGAAVVVTPSDTVDLDYVSHGLYVGGVLGDVRVLMEDGTDVTFDNFEVGHVHPIRVKRVFNTNTTATNIVAMYYD